MDFEMRRGQATIWIILAVVLICVIILFLLLQGDETSILINRELPEFNVESYLSSCVGEQVREATKVMLPRGGFIAPKNFKIYNRTEVEYICDTKGYFEPCINQHPVLIDEMEKEILAYISPGIDSCIRELEYEIERRGGEVIVSSGGATADVELEYDKVIVNIQKNMEVEERDSKRSFSGFDVRIGSAAYNLGVIAIEIATQEASFCYFESIGYSLANPRYSVKKKMLSDQSKIYVLNDGRFKEEMMVAVRSCALPEGMPG